MARPGLDLWTQLVALHCSRLAAPSLSVLEFEGQFQQEVWPHCGWKEPTGQGRQVLLGQEKKTWYSMFKVVDFFHYFLVFRKMSGN